MSWCISTTVVSDYEVYHRGSVPDRGRGFYSSLSVQTGPGADPPSWGMLQTVLFPEVKLGRDVMLITHTHLVPKSVNVGLTLPLRQAPPYHAEEQLYFCNKNCKWISYVL